VTRKGKGLSLSGSLVARVPDLSIPQCVVDLITALANCQDYLPHAFRSGSIPEKQRGMVHVSVSWYVTPVHEWVHLQSLWNWAGLLTGFPSHLSFSFLIADTLRYRTRQIAKASRNGGWKREGLHVCGTLLSRSFSPPPGDNCLKCSKANVCLDV